MPGRCGQKDSKGTFCRWGGHGKKYYYTPGNKQSMARARKKAEAQGRAAHAHGYRGSNMDIAKKLPDVKPNQSEQDYVSECIKYETKRSPDRDPKQISRMCYEKYREATGKRRPPGIKSEMLNDLKNSLTEIQTSLDIIRKNL
jgi:hypothetical protein